VCHLAVSLMSGGQLSVCLLWYKNAFQCFSLYCSVIKSLSHSSIPYCSHLAPTRAVILRGGEADCREVAAYARSAGIEAFAPGNRSVR
jgi:hypothetical protein